MKRKIKPYLITYVVWLCIILLIILNSKMESGDPYPLGAGILVSVLSSFLFSCPVWIVQIILFKWWKKKKIPEKIDIPMDDHQGKFQIGVPGLQKMDGSHMTQEELLLRVMDKASAQGWVSTSFLQIMFRLKYAEASRLIDILENNGWIEPLGAASGEKRKLIISKEDWSLNRQRFTSTKNVEKIGQQEIDGMDGHQFENYCSSLLLKNGFTKAEVTKASGDFGIDVLGEKDGITYAIQCKCYSEKVGNHAVQEALSGAQFYHCMVAVVMTNNYFTPAAIETARRTNVLLWNRDKVLEMASNNYR